jgi:hypothetical protein
MKTLQTKLFKELVEGKCTSPSKEKPYNPWAVCTDSTGGPDDGEAKFYRCIEHVKDQNAGKKKKKKKSSDLITAKNVLKNDVPSKDQKSNLDDIWLDSLNRSRNKKLSVAFVIEAKKKERWMQDAVKKPGAFTEYCGGEVTEECIQRGKKSPDTKTKQRANLADTFRDQAKKKKND